MKRNIVMLLLLMVIAIQIQAKPIEKVYVVLPNAKNEVISNTAGTFVNYLKKTYKGEAFSITQKQIPGAKNIFLKLSQDSTLINNEAYRISGTGKQLLIEGKTPRALINGVFGFLKSIGWEFYMSFEIPPSNAKKLNFEGVNLNDAPLYDTRIIFNWHNFLSGCSGWDLKDWQSWISQSSKMGFNVMMVHTYGNNPIQQFKYKGQEKALGYLTTTMRGRDWGAQHVNDVRNLYGGNLFTEYEFGSVAAKVEEKDRNAAAVGLMKQVFKYAKSTGMEVCYAIDIDTWMSNPQNIINTLPQEALIKVGQYNIANPEHLEGLRYYQAQIDNVFENYPNIDRLVAWMREPTSNPISFSIWANMESKELPAKWKAEYSDIMTRYPELKDEKPYPGMFAISKLMSTYRSILNGRNPEMQLLLGSWDFDFAKKAAMFLPKEIGLIPLDFNYTLKTEKTQELLQKVGKDYKLYPVVWSQHDDHRYLGRPYITYDDFNTKLTKTNSLGYGIIHWMTHPHDLLFNSYNAQVWKNTANQSFEISIEKYASSMLKKADENLQTYFKEWFLKGPQFGRETSNNFLILSEEYHLGGYKSSLEVVESATNRLAILKKVNKASLNAQGLKEYNYQVGTEEFIVSFFNNHHRAHQAYLLLKEQKQTEALKFTEALDPEKSIELFGNTLKNYGATKGEEGVLISLNLRWLPDLIDLRQRTGLEAIKINLRPTYHDPLAQIPGTYTFFVEKDKTMWLSKGEKETSLKVFTDGTLPLKTIKNGWAEITKPSTLSLKTIRGSQLFAGTYEIQLIQNQSAGANKFDLSIIEGTTEIGKLGASGAGKPNTVIFITTGTELKMIIKPLAGTVKLSGWIVKKIG